MSALLSSLDMGHPVNPENFLWSYQWAYQELTKTPLNLSLFLEFCKLYHVKGQKVEWDTRPTAPEREEKVGRVKWRQFAVEIEVFLDKDPGFCKSA